MKRAVLVFMAVSLACGRSRSTPPPDAPDVVTFRIAPGAGGGFVATHEARGTTARFRIDLKLPAAPSESPSFSSGAFTREAGSDGSVLMEHLAQALQAKRVPPAAAGVQTLPFGAAVLGQKLSRGPGKDAIAGEFTSDPAGGWIVTKLFLGEGEGEVFLALDPEAGWGQFIMKDPAYGDDVVAELGRILQGQVMASLPSTSTPAAAIAPPTPSPDPDEARVAELIGMLTDPESGQPQRRAALEKLGKMGPRARSAASHVASALQDTDPFVRERALEVIGKLGGPPEEGIAAVTPFLTDADELNQVRAAEALWRFGDADRAVEHLTRCLKGDRYDFAARALSEMGPDARRAVPALVNLLQNRRSQSEGLIAARALGELGSVAEMAAPALRAAAQDPDQKIREAADWALGRIRASAQAAPAP